MNKLHNTLCNYLVFAFPAVLAEMIWSHFQSGGTPAAGSNLVTRALWEILSWNLMLWFVGLAVFFILLILSRPLQKSILVKVANIRESDEREEYITGKASRTSYISTLSILIFLLFLSIFRFEVGTLPPDQVVNGKTKVVSISADVDLFNSAVRVDPRALVAFNDLPLSKTGIIMLIIVWQLAAYNWSAARQLKNEE